MSKGWNVERREHFLLLRSNVSSGSLYSAYIQQYANLCSDYTFGVSKYSCSDNNTEIVLQLTENKFFPVEPSVKQLATIKKLTLFTKIIYLFQYMKLNLEGVLTQTTLDIYMSQGSEVKFLPSSPDHFKAPMAERDIIKSIGFGLFGIDVPNSIDASLLHESKIPHEIANYLLNRPTEGYDDVRQSTLQRLDDFVFFQAWIYCDAVRVALADDELSLVEVKNLRKISSRLALTDEQAEQLENIAMLKRQSFEHFLQSLYADKQEQRSIHQDQST